MEKVLNCLWIGPSLAAVDRACLRSMLRFGHEVRLWCYDEPAGVPAGVELADAGIILPRSTIIRYPGGSTALFANRFRYELQRLGKGIWIDLDHYLLRAVEAGGDYLLAREEPHRINNGVLKIPPHSPLLPPLLALFDGRTVPAWLPLHRRLAAHWRRLRVGYVDLGRLGWGVTGPAAITALAARHGLSHLAVPPDVYAPVPWQQASWIADPARGLDEWVTDRTVAVHIWNSQIAAFKGAPARKGSFLARLQEEGSL